MTNAIDLSKLPQYDPVPQLSLDEIIDESVAWFADQGFDLGSAEDPAYRVMLVFAYREKLLREELNTARKNEILAYAKGPALDHIGVTYHRVQRLSNENDVDYLARIVAAPEGFSTAGPEQGYLFFARSADANVADVSYDSPEPLLITLTVLARDKLIANQALLDAVSDAVNPDHIRPQGDVVSVEAAQLLPYTVNAVLHIEDGSPDKNFVLEAALNAVQAYCDNEYRLTGYVNEGRLYANLYQEGVSNVDLSNWVDVQASDVQAPLCTAINLTVA